MMFLNYLCIILYKACKSYGSLERGGYFNLSELNGSLAVIDYNQDVAGKLVCQVWVNGSSFTKLFTVKDN
ncbi:hypothetical protein L1987_79587 [Smallanthus sonchifolius]|uniref:Uncharacterized protein n=1 Tax=Smallanthus sonchifolius TaxID=185202 RepID=A0ACB8YKH3_9ASTR|nr:hypothetical protein L1987_79587 [Smallanthus sonchifolius]